MYLCIFYWSVYLFVLCSFWRCELWVVTNDVVGQTTSIDISIDIDINFDINIDINTDIVGIVNVVVILRWCSFAFNRSSTQRRRSMKDNFDIVSMSNSMTSSGIRYHTRSVSTSTVVLPVLLVLSISYDYKYLREMNIWNMNSRVSWRILILFKYE